MIVTRPPSLAKNFEHIYSGDEALDTEKDGFKDAYKLWTDTGEMAHLEPFINDEDALMRFTLKPLGIEAKQLVTSIAKEVDEDEGISFGVGVVLCKLGLVGVDGLYTPDGDPIPFSRKRDKKTKLMYVADEPMEWLANVDGGALVFELGIRVFTQAFISQD